MRKLLLGLLLVLLLFSTSCKKEKSPTPYSCESELNSLPPLYLQAVKSHLLNIENGNSPEKNSIELNKHNIDSLYKIFSAINNLRIPETDSVFNLYKIYTLSSIDELTFISIVVDDTIKAARDTILLDLIDKYNLTYHNTQRFFPGFSLEFSTCPLKNPRALQREIESTTNYSCYVNLGGFTVRTKKIIISKNNTSMSTTVTYSIGYGDCLAGCIYKRFWEFEVDKNFVATFIKAYGDPAPPL